MGTENLVKTDARSSQRRSGTAEHQGLDVRGTADRRGADDGLVGRRPEEVAALSAGIFAFQWQCRNDLARQAFLFPCSLHPFLAGQLSGPWL